MTSLQESHRAAVKRLAKRIAEHDILWALTGSTSFVLQGVSLSPNDIDVQTTEEGAYAIEDLFEEHVTDPVTFSKAESIRSHFGAFDLEGVRVEVMGDLQKRSEDGTWGVPPDLTEHKRTVDLDGTKIPVLSLEYEAEAYEQVGRTERADLLREHAEG